jgi:hypothetical protein
LGPLGTAATNKPIVPTPGDYDDGEIGGMMTGRGKRSTGRKPARVPWDFVMDTLGQVFSENFGFPCQSTFHLLLHNHLLHHHPRLAQ